jgi:hypothetical protein
MQDFLEEATISNPKQKARPKAAPFDLCEGTQILIGIRM